MNSISSKTVSHFQCNWRPTSSPLLILLSIWKMNCRQIFCGRLSHSNRVNQLRITNSFVHSNKLRRAYNCTFIYILWLKVSLPLISIYHKRKLIVIYFVSFIPFGKVRRQNWCALWRKRDTLRCVHSPILTWIIQILNGYSYTSATFVS